MALHPMNRRGFAACAAAAAGAAAGALQPCEAAKKEPAPSRRGILNFNENMEYRKLGKTGLMVSAVCLGGHWKRVGKHLAKPIEATGYHKMDMENLKNPEFQKNRHEVVSRCIELGVNYVDACTEQEVLAYSHALKGRRDKFYIGASWYQKEPRNKDYRTVAKLMESLDTGLRDAGLEYVDIWRITLPADNLPDLGELQRIEEATFGVLEKAKKQGKIRFSGVSTHNRPWLKSVIEQYPNELQVACTPYTANSKELPTDSVFSAIRKHNVGIFGIKPFADNALFKGDGTANSPFREEDNQRARLALRYVLNNPAITAPIPGMATMAQVENAAKAIMERRKLDRAEQQQLDKASRHMWANLRPGYEWLRNWEYV
ncbi:MAG: aldo/keto reductase [Bryobacterales bacterium]|nr:aldo/keto reductase [Bryobacterales bacterium]